MKEKGIAIVVCVIAAAVIAYAVVKSCVPIVKDFSQAMDEIAASYETDAKIDAPGAWKITNASYKITETNDTWWRFSYRFTVVNHTDSELCVAGEVDFRDAAGFSLGGPNFQNDLVIPARNNKSFTGHDLIQPPSNANVSRVVVKLGRGECWYQGIRSKPTKECSGGRLW